MASSESRTPRRITTRRANDLDGKSWTRNSLSIWSDIRKSPEELRLKHPALFPGQLVARLLESFTTFEEKIVVDPFSGIGSTAIAAARAGKTGIGFEISPEFLEIARGRLEQSGRLEEAQGLATFHALDSRRMGEVLEPESVDIVITSPPYWNILTRKRTADYKAIRNYGEDEQDLGRIDDYPQFIESLEQVFRPVHTALKPGKYCMVVVMDLRQGPRFFPFHQDVSEMMRRIGFIYDDLIIWDRRHEYNFIRPLGYPAVFRVNKVHEFILVFQKPHASDPVKSRGSKALKQGSV